LGRSVDGSGARRSTKATASFHFNSLLDTSRAGGASLPLARYAGSPPSNSLRELASKSFFNDLLAPEASPRLPGSPSFQISISIRAGSSRHCFTRFKNVTASRPSTRRWSYVNATYIIGLMTTAPFTATGRS